MIENLTNNLIRISGDSLNFIGSSEIHYSNLFENDNYFYIDLRGIDFVLNNKNYRIFNLDFNEDIHIDSVVRFIISKEKGYKYFVIGYYNDKNELDELEFNVDSIYIELLENKLSYRSISDYTNDCNNRIHSDILENIKKRNNLKIK